MKNYRQIFKINDMKKFHTDEQYNLICPSGDYTNIKNFYEIGDILSFGSYSVFSDNSKFGQHYDFGHGCKFGDNCSFNYDSVFGNRCSFGDNCKFEYGSNGNFCTFGKSCKFSNRSFGDGCIFDINCEFGHSCYFGANCEIGSGSKLKKNSRFGENCKIGNFCELNLDDINSNISTIGGGSIYLGMVLAPGINKVITMNNEFFSWETTKGKYYSYLNLIVANEKHFRLKLIDKYGQNSHLIKIFDCFVLTLKQKEENTAKYQLKD